jgi:integrase
MTTLRLEFVHVYRDRHGKLRRYFRRRGSRRIPLPGLPGSAEFMQTYQAALADVAVPREIGASRTKPGTVNAAIVGYRQSLAYRELSPGSQRMYRQILEHVRNETGERQIAGLDQRLIVKRLSLLKPVAARNWLKVIRALLAFAVAEGFREDNPAHGIKPAKHKTRNHRPWTPEEIARYEAAHPIGTKARLAFALGLYTLQRRGDVIRMGRQHLRDGLLTVSQEKTGRGLTLPVRPELQTVLDGTAGGHLTFLVTDAGRPYSKSWFTPEFRRWCDEAGLPRDCVFHGLRSTGCTVFADAGCSPYQIAAWSGHMTLREVERYTRAANQKKLAASGLAKVAGRLDQEHDLVANPAVKVANPPANR